MNAIVRYEEMRLAVERCARIDEAAEIMDKAAALQAYARQRDDRDLEVWTAEIKLRASVRIGELVRELETAEHEGPGAVLPSGGKYKRDAIVDAGLSTSAAYRYQELAGTTDDRGMAAGKAAAEHYFASARATQEPATMAGLRSAVRDALTATLGPRRVRERGGNRGGGEHHVEPVGDDFIDWQAAVKHLAEADVDLEDLAGRLPTLRAKMLREAETAVLRLNQWIAHLGTIQ